MSSRFKKGVPTSSGDYQQATGSQRLATDHSARVLGTRQWLFPARTGRHRTFDGDYLASAEIFDPPAPTPTITFNGSFQGG